MSDSDIHGHEDDSSNASGSEGNGGSSSNNNNRNSTSTHISALDAIASNNSLFTAAVFIGISTDASKNNATSSSCAAGRQMQDDMVSFHVYAFTCFLFSSLVALALKQAVRNARKDGPHAARVDRATLRAGLMASAAGSILGCGFLMLGLVNFVQVKLGRLGCGDTAASAGAVVALVTLIPSAMLISSAIVIHAFNR